MDKRRPATALVQGGVVGEVTQVPATQNQRLQQKKFDKIDKMSCRFSIVVVYWDLGELMWNGIVGLGWF